MWRSVFLLCWLAVLNGSVLAQQMFEVIPLKYRLPEQVIPLLQPLLEPGASLTGGNNRLFIKTSASNLRQIQLALASFDVPMRRLMVSVSQSRDARQQTQGGGIESGRVILGPNGVVRVEGNVGFGGRQQDSTALSEQRVQTVDGGEASIFMGRSLALPMRRAVRQMNGSLILSETWEYVEVGSGFVVRPQLQGERVLVEIAPRMEHITRDGQISGSRLLTQVSGRVGEWLSLGGGETSSRDRLRAWAGGQGRMEEQSAQLWLKIDVLAD